MGAVIFSLMSLWKEEGRRPPPVLQPVARAAPPPPQAAPAKPFVPRPEPVREPPPGEWGVAMSKKTRNLTERHGCRCREPGGC